MEEVLEEGKFRKIRKDDHKTSRVKVQIQTTGGGGVNGGIRIRKKMLF